MTNPEWRQLLTLLLSQRLELNAIESALKTERGMLRPEDPMADFNRESLDVSLSEMLVP